VSVNAPSDGPKSFVVSGKRSVALIGEPPSFVASGSWSASGPSSGPRRFAGSDGPRVGTTVTLLIAPMAGGARLVTPPAPPSP